jgi:glycosyltransferase involved in cell wall biosynthesis
MTSPPPAGDPVFVSVVTPFYNTGEYLAECIESVLRQTHRRFEYILVDNQSTDHSLAIAESYAKKDARIRVLRTPRFLTQMQNMNFAVEQVDPRAAYCKTLFADDYLYPRCLEEMIAIGESDPRVGMIGAYYVRGSGLDGVGLDTTRAVFPGHYVCRRYFFDDVFPFGSQSTVMYRASVIRSRTPFFHDNLHPDSEAALRILRDHDFGFVHQALSFMRTQDGSLTQSARGFYPEALDRLINVKKYGRSFTTAAEYRTIDRAAERVFYRGLAKQWAADLIGARKPGFWEYQLEGLQAIDERIRPAALARHLVAGVLEGPFRLGAFVRMVRDFLTLKTLASRP